MSELTVSFQVQAYLSQFKIPTELIRKNFKSIQKLIEKHKKTSAEEVLKISKNAALPADMKLRLVRKAIASVNTYKAKLDALEKLDVDYRLRIAARNAHLQELANFTTDDGDVLDLNNYNLISWYREETQLAIIDYLIKSSVPDSIPPTPSASTPFLTLLSQDHPNVGMRLLYHLETQQPDFAKLIDFDVYADYNRVFMLIFHYHDLSAVQAWYNENKLQLKKVNSNIDFEIKYCQLLLLIEEGSVPEAIAFSHSNLLAYGNKETYELGSLQLHFESNLQKMEKIGAFLVYLTMKDAALIWVSTDIALRTPSFQELEKSLAQGRWELLAQCFLDDFTVLYGIPKTCPLYIYLLAGLSSLKTKSCYCNSENDIYHRRQKGVSPELSPLELRKDSRGPNHYYQALGKVNNCPVCLPELYNLSRNLPYAQLITLIFNSPFRLPNGNIYPFDKLVQGQTEALLREAKVEDPLTKDVYLIDDCTRVYPA